MNADPDVMEFFPSTLTEEASTKSMHAFQQEIDTKGFGLWPVELKSSGEMIGFIGLHEATFAADFTPCIEIGWRLRKSVWNQGLATEGALACLEFAFGVLKLPEIYSFTAVLNKRSEHIMEKIGMTRAGEFDHPKVAEGDRLRRHVLYRICSTR